MNKKRTIDLYKFLGSFRAVYLILFEILLGITTSAGLFWVFGKITDTILDKGTFQFDQSVISFFYSIRGHFLTEMMKFFSFLGMDFIFIASIIVFIFFILKKHKPDAFLFVFTVVIGTAINSLLKIFIRRPRPVLDPLIHEATYSFPSGHSMNSFIFYFTVVFFIYRYTRNKKLSLIITVLFSVLVFLIGISRVYLGVHYPSDVLAGFTAGFLWVATILVIDKTITLSKYFKQLREGREKI